MRTSAIEKWYASQCNGEWEHSYGIKINTLDNPGWHVLIDLRETRKQDSALERNRIDRTEMDWIEYWVEKKQFGVACGPLNLNEAFDIFVNWFNSD
jgi:Immunity protein 53